MKLCVLANLFGDLTLDQTLAKLKPLGVEAVEIGAGGFPGKNQCDPEVLLADEAKLQEFIDTFKKYDIELAALACHGNPVHPDKAIAESFDRDFKNAVLLAEKVGVDTVITFSGCPGGSPEDKTPNWATCAWPDDFLGVLDTKHYTDELNRSWVFRAVGYGHDAKWWKDIASALRLVGYDKVMSIEHEDSLMSIEEGLEKAVETLKPCIIKSAKPSTISWA